MKKLAFTLVLLVLAGLAAGCAPKPLKVATTTGPHAELLYAAREMAARDGLVIEILEYDDNTKPNELLAAGEVDANSFQPLPYFEALVADRRLPLAVAAKTVVFPVALYSKKVRNLAELPAAATVAIPADPGGGGRALLLLEKTGLLTLLPGVGLKAAVTDIVANPRGLRIVEVHVPDIGPRLGDFDLVALGSTYAVAHGLVPARDALAAEGADSPHPHIIAVHVKDKDSAAVRKLIAAYQSDHVRDYMLRRFQGAVIPAW